METPRRYAVLADPAAAILKTIMELRCAWLLLSMVASCGKKKEDKLVKK